MKAPARLTAPVAVMSAERATEQLRVWPNAGKMPDSLKRQDGMVIATEVPAKSQCGESTACSRSGALATEARSTIARMAPNVALPDEWPGNSPSAVSRLQTPRTAEVDSALGQGETFESATCGAAL